MRRNRHGSVGVPKIAPDARRPLGIEVYHYRAAARELVRDGEADCDGGFPAPPFCDTNATVNMDPTMLACYRSCNATMLAC